MEANNTNVDGDINSKISSPISKNQSSNPNIYEFEETFLKLPLGLVMSHKKGAVSICVSGFVTLAASHEGRIVIGDELVCVNGISLEGMKSKAVFKTISSSTCPLTIQFRRSLSNNLKHQVDTDLPLKTKLVDPSLLDNQTTINNIEENAAKISSMIAEINTISLVMKNHTGVGNDAINTIHFNKLSGFRDASAGLGYRLDIALEKLEMLERKYLPPVIAPVVMAVDAVQNIVKEPTPHTMT